MLEGIAYINSLPEWNNRDSFDNNAIRDVLYELGNPQDIPMSVHVAGTNGKGSTCSLIASILGTNGLSVGLSISPHLIKLEERFVIDGSSAKLQDISAAIIKVKEASDNISKQLTYHEVLTASAFVLFKDLDWIVIETGLGGRLDASNVIKKPVFSVITSIGLDHQHLLGDTIEKIAFEKAGIIKEGSSIVVGSVPKEAYGVIKNMSKDKKSSIYSLEKDFFLDELNEVIETKHTPYSYIQTTNRANYILDTIKIPNLPNIASIKNNVALAVKFGILMGFSETSIVNGICNSYWPARLESIEYRNKQFILDCAHNPQSMDILTDYLQSNEIDNIEIVFGVLNTKDWKYMIKALSPYIGKWNIVLPISEAAVSEDLIKKELEENCISESNFFGSDYEQLLTNIFNSDSKVLVTGSIYMLGKVKEMIYPKEKKIWLRY